MGKDWERCSSIEPGLRGRRMQILGNWTMGPGGYYWSMVHGGQSKAVACSLDYGTGCMQVPEARIIKPDECSYLKPGLRD